MYLKTILIAILVVAAIVYIGVALQRSRLLPIKSIGVFIDTGDIVTCTQASEATSAPQSEYIGRQIASAEDVYKVLSKIREKQNTEGGVRLFCTIRKGVLPNGDSIQWENISQNLNSQLPTTVYCLGFDAALAIGAGIDCQRLQRQIMAIIDDTTIRLSVLFAAGIFNTVQYKISKRASLHDQLAARLVHAERILESAIPVQFTEQFANMPWAEKDLDTLREGWNQPYAAEIHVFLLNNGGRAFDLKMPGHSIKYYSDYRKYVVEAQQRVLQEMPTLEKYTRR